MGADIVKIFCPKCKCMYHPPPVRSRSSHHNNAGAAGVDGAAFGTTFPHLFLMTFSNLVPDRLPKDSAYVPRVFGFRVHMSARQRNSGVAATNSSARPSAPTRRVSSSRRSSGGTAAADEGKDGEAGKGSTDVAVKGKSGIPQSIEATKDSNQTAVTPVTAVVSSTQKNGEEDDANKKSKTGKRRTDEIAKVAPTNGSIESNSSKRRRKGES